MSDLPVSDIYVDESSQTKHRFLVLGGLIIPHVELDAFCEAVEAARQPELPANSLKWGRVSRTKLEGYKRVVDVFFDPSAAAVHFHSLVVDTHQQDHRRWNKGEPGDRVPEGSLSTGAQVSSAISRSRLSPVSPSAVHSAGDRETEGYSQPRCPEEGGWSRLALQACPLPLSVGLFAIASRRYPVGRNRLQAQWALRCSECQRSAQGAIRSYSAPSRDP